jgi:MFS superfamily sulfate permease-like transporter
VVVIIAIAPALSVLPRAVLSAIVVNAVWGLMDFGAMRRYSLVRRNDIIAAVIAAVGVLAFGPLNGLLLAVAGSMLGLIFRSTRVDVEVMGRVPHEKAAWGSIRNHAERSTYAGVIVLRIDVPLFWVTASPANDSILALVDSTPGTHALVLDLEATNQMDTTTADALADLLAALRQRDVDLFLVRVMWPVRKALRRSGLLPELGEDHLWHSISQGVREARRLHGLLGRPAQEGVPLGHEASADEPLDSGDEEHIVARQPGPAPPDDGGR